MLVFLVYFLLFANTAYSNSITIEGRILEGNLKNDIITITGPIKLKSESFNFKSDKAIVKFREPLQKFEGNDIYQIELSGSPAEGFYKNYSITSSRITINMEKQTMLFEDTQISSSNYQLKAAKILYNFGNDQLQIDGSQNNLIQLDLNDIKKD